MLSAASLTALPIIPSATLSAASSAVPPATPSATLSALLSVASTAVLSAPPSAAPSAASCQLHRQPCCQRCRSCRQRHLAEMREGEECDGRVRWRRLSHLQRHRLNQHHIVVITTIVSSCRTAGPFAGPSTSPSVNNATGTGLTVDRYTCGAVCVLEDCTGCNAEGFTYSTIALPAGALQQCTTPIIAPSTAPPIVPLAAQSAAPSTVSWAASSVSPSS